jgi:hypothetical protein
LLGKTPITYASSRPCACSPPSGPC